MRFRHEQTPNNQIPMNFPGDMENISPAPSFDFEEERAKIKKETGIMDENFITYKDGKWYIKDVEFEKYKELYSKENDLPYHRGQN
jgi:hypothetical protein